MYATRLASSIRPALVGFRQGRFFSGATTDGQHDISRLSKLAALKQYIQLLTYEDACCPS